MDKMVTRGRLSIHLQEAPKLSIEWGECQNATIHQKLSENKVMTFLNRVIKKYWKILLAAGVGLISVKERWSCLESLDK